MNGFTLGTHYTSARRWYAPLDLAKVNNSEIERVTEMGKKKKKHVSKNGAAINFCEEYSAKKLLFRGACKNVRYFLLLLLVRHQEPDQW